MVFRLACVLLLLAGTAAHAETCAPARLLSSVPLHSAEPESNIRTVPVSLNGQTRDMILDTGGAVTQLSRSVVAELGLPLWRSGAAVYDINGRVSHHFATVKDFSFGELRRADAALMVWPEEKRPYAGELAQDMLQPYDVDVDFAKGPAHPVRQGPLPRPLGMDAFGSGGDAQQGLASAYPSDIMRLPAARRDFGLGADAEDMRLYGAINGDAFLNGYLHGFRQLSFGGMRFDNPDILIVPDIMNRNADQSPMARNRAYRHNADLILPELSLGMDVLKHLRLYLSFGEQALYVTPADAAVTPQP